MTATVDIRRRDLDTPAGPLALLEAGVSGHPALLVPGYTGSKEDFALILAPLAQAGYRVVAVDLRGQFESVGADDPALYTVEALGRDLLAVLADLTAADESGRRPHLLGHSFGGLVARSAVLADPTSVASLVLLGSGPAAIGGNRRERMAALEPVLAAGGMVAVYDALEQLAAGDPKYVDATPEAREFLRRRFLASSATGLVGMGDALRSEPDRVAELRATAVPLLVACGDHDDAWAPATQEEMAARLGAPFARIPGAVHSPAAQNPQATARLLLDFWRRAESGGPA